MADISKIKLPNGTTYDVKDTTKLPTSGGTITGAVSLAGTDFNLKTSGTSSDDSSDIVWYYGNGQEKARLWTNNEYTAASGLNYRVYKKDGTSLATGTIPLANTNTTYTFANGTNGFTVTPSGGTAQTITVTPSITNNVTGSGTSGYIAKFNGANTITNAVALGSDTTKYLRNDGTWQVPTGTTYSQGTGISISGTTINHSNSVTAGTAGTSSATSGSTLAVPYVTYDAQGHVTASGTHTHTVTGFATTDTKNTAGSTDTSSKIFLIGATSQAANPQTYSDDHCYVTDGQLQTKSTLAQAGVYANTDASGTAGGLSLYSTNDPSSYGITMRNGSNLGRHGYVQGDWAGYLCFSGDTNRGWIFRATSQGANVASISNLGHAVFNGSVTVGGNSANTSGCRMEFNTTTQSVDFVFN